MFRKRRVSALLRVVRKTNEAKSGSSLPCFFLGLLALGTHLFLSAIV